jgi:hypothetical protein
MDLPICARKCIEFLLRCICNHFAVTADKEPYVVDGIPGLSLCVCVYIYMFVCVYVYI